MDLSNPPTGAAFHCWKQRFRLVGFCLIFPNLEIALNQHSFHSWLIDRLFSFHFGSNLSCDFRLSYEKWFPSFEPSSLNACRGTGAFPPPENQKNKNELKAFEGDPQLEQGRRFPTPFYFYFFERWKSKKRHRLALKLKAFFFLLKFRNPQSLLSLDYLIEGPWNDRKWPEMKCNERKAKKAKRRAPTTIQ